MMLQKALNHLGPHPLPQLRRQEIEMGLTGNDLDDCIALQRSERFFQQTGGAVEIERVELSLARLQQLADLRGGRCEVVSNDRFNNVVVYAMNPATSGVLLSVPAIAAADIRQRPATVRVHRLHTMPTKQERTQPEFCGMRGSPWFLAAWRIEFLLSILPSLAVDDRRELRLVRLDMIRGLSALSPFGFVDGLYAPVNVLCEVRSRAPVPRRQSDIDGIPKYANDDTGVPRLGEHGADFEVVQPTCDLLRRYVFGREPLEDLLYDLDAIRFNRGAQPEGIGRILCRSDVLALKPFPLPIVVDLEAIVMPDV